MLLPVQTGLRHFTLWVRSLGLDNGAKTFLNIVNVVISLLSKYFGSLFSISGQAGKTGQNVQGENLVEKPAGALVR